MSTLAIQHSQARRFPGGQQGATLIVALIFLVVLTLLGIAAAQNSSLEERMASNTRSRDIAFQAAQAALNHVEQNLSAGQNIRTLNFAGGSPGLFVYNAATANDANYWGSTYAWSTATARQPTVVLSQVASQPLYVVEQMPSEFNAVTGKTTEFYRATARGVGKDPSAVVILQAVYSYTP
ncbi:PilX N-terminal domain-containing pilus assembly protein [Sulfuriferula sp. GW1]|uniref:pilus assembly PilX family protein n=1 Tax=Sulfuriferula sp. GW1 TaxID=3345111 RepID=UPI0039B007C7